MFLQKKKKKKKPIKFPNIELINCLIDPYIVVMDWFEIWHAKWEPSENWHVDVETCKFQTF